VLFCIAINASFVERTFEVEGDYGGDSETVDDHHSPWRQDK